MSRLSRALRLVGRSNCSPLTPKRWTAHRPPLAVERLDDRSLPASLSLTNTVLSYTAGNPVANNLTVTQGAGTYTFNDTAETITTTVAGSTGSGTHAVTVPASGVSALSV